MQQNWRDGLCEFETIAGYWDNPGVCSTKATNQVLALDELNNPSYFQYDGLNRLSKSVDAALGTVRVTCSEVVGAQVLPPILAKLRHAYPNLQIELSLTNANEDLLRREADVGFTTCRSGHRIVVHRVGRGLAVGALRGMSGSVEIRHETARRAP